MLNQRKNKMWMRNPKNEIYGVLLIGFAFVASSLLGSLLGGLL